MLFSCLTLSNPLLYVLVLTRDVFSTLTAVLQQMGNNWGFKTVVFFPWSQVAEASTEQEVVAAMEELAAVPETLEKKKGWRKYWLFGPRVGGNSWEKKLWRRSSNLFCVALFVRGLFSSGVMSGETDWRSPVYQVRIHADIQLHILPNYVVSTIAVESLGGRGVDRPRFRWFAFYRRKYWSLVVCSLVHP